MECFGTLSENSITAYLAHIEQNKIPTQLGNFAQYSDSAMRDMIGADNCGRFADISCYFEFHKLCNIDVMEEVAQSCALLT